MNNIPSKSVLEQNLEVNEFIKNNIKSMEDLKNWLYNVPYQVSMWDKCEVFKYVAEKYLNINVRNICAFYVATDFLEICIYNVDISFYALDLTNIENQSSFNSFEAAIQYAFYKLIQNGSEIKNDVNDDFRYYEIPYIPKMGMTQEEFWFFFRELEHIYAGRELYDAAVSMGLRESADILNEAASVVGKRKKVEELILKTFSLIDPTGANTKKQKEFFSKMNDKQFDTWFKGFLKDPKANFYMELLPYKNEPTLKEIKDAADFLKVPLEEYVYFRNDGNKENPLRTRDRVPVGFLNLKRMQQILSKKNSFSLDINVRNAKTGQVTGDSKVARLSDMENYSFNVMGADNALKELMGPRSDNRESKQQLYQNIATYGYAKLADLESDVEDSQTINTIDVYFMGAGIITDLVSPNLLLPRTIKDKKQRKTKETDNKNI